MVIYVKQINDMGKCKKRAWKGPRRCNIQCKSKDDNINHSLVLFSYSKEVWNMKL